MNDFPEITLIANKWQSQDCQDSYFSDIATLTSFTSVSSVMTQGYRSVHAA